MTTESDGADSLPAWANDDLAKREEKHWTDEEALRGIERRNKGRLLHVWGWIVPALMIVFTALFVAAVVVWAVHFLTPLCWLSEEQLSKLQSIIFSGSLGAVVSTYLQKHLFDEGQRRAR